MALNEATVDISADGNFAVASWEIPAPGAALRSVLVRIDIGTGERTVIFVAVAELGSFSKAA